MEGSSYMKLPHDLSGSMAKNRFKNEMLWGIHRILELYPNEEEFSVVFDYVCDIEVHLKGDKYEFYQIKTSNSGEGYTYNKLVKVGKKEKSILGKLYTLKEQFTEDKCKIKLAIVANKPFKGNDDKLYNSVEKLEFNSLDVNTKTNIEQALKDELQINEVYLENVIFIHTTMDLVNPKNTLTGEIVNFFNDILKVQIKKPVALYNVLIGKISQKAEYELELNSYDELLQKKSISKKEVSEIFKRHIELSNDVVNKSNATIEKIYANNYGKMLRMKTSLSFIVLKINSSTELKEKEKEIIEYINNNEDLLDDNLERIIEKLYEKFRSSFNIEYSEENIKSFLVFILMKREEEMYE